MLTSERLADIERRLTVHGRVVAADLARLYETSEDTVRRDLRALAAQGRCRRVHGGALPPMPARGPVSVRAGIASAAKAALGEAMARLVEPGSTVFVDAGSTTLACAERMRVAATVITHAPAIAAALVENPAVRLVTLGGQVDREVGAATGAGVLAAIETIRPDLLLLGACGVDAEAGITAQSVEDAAVKRALAARAGRVVVAADAGKLGTSAPFAVVDLAAIDVLLIEAGTPAERKARLAATGVALVEVETGR
ncbi:DeoR/GlpR family DNA-binding transcription regulator [Amaricoccus sp.]|uniref:DeoR/GlpR family DNA-binding transcription regulator n=1 Tax=Amaricoccus sp. TaxID=1872485 RepID=UPI001B7B815C|nr:DeoR/GlpR family DNA-binding transcription regulator [Amaricoccus sp.]MBP7002726.1 DeoR/GlpR transcriptional regulator [Amaricoccus sp.]